MRFWIRVICNKERSDGTCLALMCDNSIIMVINMCDGWQRQVSLSKLKIHGCNNIFFTSLEANSISGLPSFCIKVYKVIEEKSNIMFKFFGPENLEKFCKMFQLKSNTMSWIPIEFTKPDPIILDEKVKVFPLILNTKQSVERKCVIAYLVQPLPRKGKFKNEEAKKLGLSLQSIKTLVSGQPVILPNGTVINPSQMYSPEIQPPSALIICIPSADYFPALYKYKTFLASFTIGVIYHSIPIDLVSNPDYINLFSSLKSCETNNIFDCFEFNDDICPRRILYGCLKNLSLCNERIFPSVEPIPKHKANTEIKAQMINTWLKVGLKVDFALLNNDYYFFPISEISKQQSLSIDSWKRLDENTKMLFTPHLANEKNAEIRKVCNKIKATKMFLNEPFIVTLGTVAGKPSETKCTSSIYINIPGIYEGTEKRFTLEYYRKSFGILLDCGEEIYGQFYDHFADINVLNSIMENIKLIFITHFHGDHMYGLQKLLKECDSALMLKYGKNEEAQARVNKENILYLIIPRCMKSYTEVIIESNNLAFPKRIKMSFSFEINPENRRHYSAETELNTPPVLMTEEQIAKNIEELNIKANPNIQEMWQYLRQILRVSNLYSFETKHSSCSHGVVLVGEKWKIVYTGDTNPCVTEVNYCKNADLLIHESTFLQAKSKTSDKNRHTSIEECVSVFDNLKPWRMLLTHLSHKVGSHACLNEEHRKRKLFFAHDHQQFLLSDAEWIHMMSPLFEEILNKEN